MPPIDKGISRSLLVLTPREHKHGFVFPAPFILEACVRGLQTFFVVAVVLVFEGVEEGGRASEEVAGFAAVAKGEVALD